MFQKALSGLNKGEKFVISIDCSKVPKTPPPSPSQHMLEIRDQVLDSGIASRSLHLRSLFLFSPGANRSYYSPKVTFIMRPQPRMSLIVPFGDLVAGQYVDGFPLSLFLTRGRIVNFLFRYTATIQVTFGSTTHASLIDNEGEEVIEYDYPMCSKSASRT